MISKSFLKSHKVAGLEFLDFQSDEFYNKLSSHLEQFINKDGVLTPESEDGIRFLIREYMGFNNITFHFQTEGNLAVDVGYFSPNHVFNSSMLDTLVPTTETSLYKWFMQNQEKVFKGSIDYRTGKVHGAFADIPVKLYINKILKDAFPLDKVAKYKVPLHGVLAGAIAHEMGHVFGGCMMLLTTCSDNLLLKAGLQCYRNTTVPSERVIIMKDITTILDIPPVKQDELRELAQKGDDSQFFLYFNKMVTQRNTQRSLSVGVETMSSEVVADMYAIRMGCDKGVIAAIGILVDHGCIRTVLNAFLQACMGTLLIFFGLVFPFFIALPLVANMVALGVIFAFTFIFSYFSVGYSGTYNADHRRFDDAARQMIMKLKINKDMPSKEKTDLVKEIEKLIEINASLKPWYDNTVLHRVMGWMFHGSDFKKIEIEHYTSVLMNHEVNLLPTQLKLANQTA